MATGVDDSLSRHQRTRLSFEAKNDLRDLSRRWLDWHAGQPGALVVTSRLTVLEALIGPVKESNPARLQRTEAALDQLLIVDLDDAVIRRAAEIRARHNFRTPDALHLATAVEAQADVYLTADRRLKSFKGVRVVDVLRDKPGTSRRLTS